MLVSLRGIAEMKGVCIDDAGRLCIGGGHHPRHSRARAPRRTIPALADMASHIGDPAVRNLGTIGGSLANNDPSACYPAAALASGATIVTNTREIAADDYFQGMFTTALEPGEIITEVKFPVPTRSNYQKFVQPASRFALVGVFVAQYPGRRARRGDRRLRERRVPLVRGRGGAGGDFTPDAVKGLKASADGMIGDLHGTPEYRAHLIGVLTARAVAAAA